MKKLLIIVSIAANILTILIIFCFMIDRIHNKCNLYVSNVPAGAMLFAGNGALSLANDWTPAKILINENVKNQDIYVLTKDTLYTYKLTPPPGGEEYLDLKDFKILCTLGESGKPSESPQVK